MKAKGKDHRVPGNTTRFEHRLSKRLTTLLFAFGAGVFLLSGLSRLFLSSVKAGSRFYMADLIDIIVVAPFIPT